MVTQNHPNIFNNYNQVLYINSFLFSICFACSCQSGINHSSNAGPHGRMAGDIGQEVHKSVRKTHYKGTINICV